MGLNELLTLIARELFMPTLNRGELADLNVFVALVRRRSFRQAAIELGVTTSALSHALRQLETRLGVKLLNRTSRSVVPTLAGAALGLALLYGGIAASQGWVQAQYGLYLPLALPSAYEWSLLGAILGAALLMGGVPAWRAYRQSLADGLSIRL